MEVRSPLLVRCWWIAESASSAGGQHAEIGMRQRVRNQVDLERAAFDRIDRQAHAVHRHRPLARDVFCQFARHFEGDSAIVALRGNTDDAADAVDVPADDVAVEPVADAQRLLQIDRRAGGKPSHAGERFARHVERQPRRRQSHHRQAGAVDGNAVAEFDAVEVKPVAVETDAHAAAGRRYRADFSHRLNDAGKHQTNLASMRRSFSIMRVSLIRSLRRASKETSSPSAAMPCAASPSRQGDR